MQKLTNQSHKFSLPEGVHYLNGAFMSPQLNSVTATGINSLKKKTDPTQITIDDFFVDTERIRGEYSKLINCNEPNRIVLIPAVSYGIANVTKNINLGGKKVIIVGEQFPSNVYPWMSATTEQGGELITVNPPDTFDNRGKKWNYNLLSAIDEETALVAIGQAHWADGTKFDLKAVRKATRDVGALLVIDGTQSVGAFPFDLGEIDPDALICAGYKWLLGPYGIGMAYYGDYFDNGRPVEENWINRLHSEDFAGLIDYENEYQPGALKYEVGEHSNFIAVPMMLEALRQVNEWQPERIQDYSESITNAPLARLKEAGFWVEEPSFRTAHLFGIRHREMPLDKVKTALSEKKVFVSYRGSSIRVAPYIHNTEEDLNVLVDTLIECTR